MISLRSKITQKVLAYFFVNRNQKKYINELARLLKVDPKNLDTKLKELEKSGLLLNESVGNQKFYFLNKKYPLFKEYLSIFNKTIGVEHLLATLFSKIKGIKNAYIFGSYAADKLNTGSDIDLLIIGSHKSLDVQRTILPIQNELGREINIIDMTKNEFENRRAKKDPLIKDIFSKTIIKLV
ncbi:MAG: nucleotidyltransferase domain-containing protein [Patescibacteria group bacterium]